jgi:hypothetical protein
MIMLFIKLSSGFDRATRADRQLPRPDAAQTVDPVFITARLSRFVVQSR